MRITIEIDEDSAGATVREVTEPGGEAVAEESGGPTERRTGGEAGRRAGDEAGRRAGDEAGRRAGDEAGRRTAEDATDAGAAPTDGNGAIGGSEPGSSATGRSSVEVETADAGAAPASLASSTPGTESSTRSAGQSADAGAAPTSLPEPRPDADAAPLSEARATDAGGAPTGAPSRSSRRTTPREEPSTGGGSPMQSGVDAGGPAITRGSHAVTNELSVDYDAVVSGTVDEVKERVERDDLDAENVLEAERAGRDRSTLVEWLERRVSEPSPSDETEQ